MYVEHGERTTNEKLAQESLYSQVTGVPRRAPEPRQPVHDVPREMPSRFSNSTTYSSWLLPDPPVQQQHLTPTPAQEYARTVSQQGHRDEGQDAPQRGAYWMQPTHTGSSGGTRNPFLR